MKQPFINHVAQRSSVKCSPILKWSFIIYDILYHIQDYLNNCHIQSVEKGKTCSSATDHFYESVSNKHFYANGNGLFYDNKPEYMEETLMQFLLYENISTANTPK